MHGPYGHGLLTRVLPEARATRDPSGRQVDLYPAAEGTSLTVLVLDRARYGESLLRYDVLCVMNSIEMMSRRMRDRDFPVYLCDWRSNGFRCTGLGLPDKFPVVLFEMFRKLIKGTIGVTEAGTSLASEVGAQPFMLYSHGKVVAYCDPFDGLDLIPDDEIELRSAEYNKHVPRRERRMPLPRIRSDAPERHSIATWEAVRLDVLRFVYSTIEPGTFFSLRREVKRQFGIQVQVAPTSVTGKHGRISTDWGTRADQSCAVTIQVSEDLPDQLKYIALAHELAHYAVHFPVILAGQLSDQLSWALPHAWCVYAEEFERSFGTGGCLEEQADLLAAHLLIPPQIRLAGIGEWAVEAGGAAPYGAGRRVTPEEAAWRLIAAYFPERNSEGISWVNYNDMQAQAARDLAQAARGAQPGEDTMYFRMLRAVLRRESPQKTRESEERVTEIHAFWDRVVNDSEILCLCPRCLDVQPPAPGVDHGTSGRRLLPPLSGEETRLPRIPLVPASSRRKAPWVNVLNPGQPAASVAEWQQNHPGQVVVLYPDRRPPQAHVFGTPEELPDERVCLCPHPGHVLAGPRPARHRA